LTYRAKASAIGASLGLLFVGMIMALDLWLLDRVITGPIRTREISFWTFVITLVVLCSVPALLFLFYQTVSCLTLRYRLDRNGVTIRWAGTEQVIPIRSILRIVPGSQFEGTIVHRRGPHWPGHERGDGLVPGMGRTRFLASRPLAEQLLLVTSSRAFAISPWDPDAFLRAFESRRELGPNRLLEQEMRPAAWATWSFWSDQRVWLLLGAAIIINVALFGFICARFPGLDAQLPLHFGRLGQVDRIGTKAELFALPIIGLIILGTNLILGLALYRRERAGSYLLWGAAAAAQTLFWLATFSILP
jgi:hypothetical protein